mmetsp:Transcript_9730/g.18328  ORF Transcript_9730/g.18328 Transcript_9730/m.18328 type:complete len:687 (-) Transcript_9730:1423-3483(-)
MLWHKRRSTVEDAAQVMVVPDHLLKHPEGIHARLQRTRASAGGEMHLRPATASTRAAAYLDAFPAKGTAPVPDVILDQLEEDVLGNQLLRGVSSRVADTRARDERARWAQEERDALVAPSSIYGRGKEQLPVDDFIATYGVRGDREAAQRVSRRAALAKESSQLQEAWEGVAGVFVPVLRAVLGVLLLILQVPTALLKRYRQLSARAGHKRLLTLGVFVTFAFLAATTRSFAPVYEMIESPHHRPAKVEPEEFAELNAMYEAMKVNPTKDRIQASWWQAVKSGSNRIFSTRADDMNYLRYDEFKRDAVEEDHSSLHSNMDGWVRTRGDRAGSLLHPPFPVSSNSHLHVLPSGTVLCAWASGDAEGADGTALVVARLQQGTARWSKGEVVSRVKGQAHMNPILVTYQSTSSTVLFYASLEAYGSMKSAQLRQLTSVDEGRTWIASSELPFQHSKGFIPRSPPVRVKHWCLEKDRLSVLVPPAHLPTVQTPQSLVDADDVAQAPPAPPCAGDKWLVPLTFVPNGFFDSSSQFSMLLTSSSDTSELHLQDNWQDLKRKTVGACLTGVHKLLDVQEGRCQPEMEQRRLGGSLHNSSLVWPSIVRFNGPNGKDMLVGFFTSLNSDFIFRAESEDDGEHWSNPTQSKLPSNNSPCAAITLNSGRIVRISDTHFISRPFDHVLKIDLASSKSG